MKRGVIRFWLGILMPVLLLLLPPVARAEEDPLVPARPAEARAYGSEVPLYDDPRFSPWSYTYEGQNWNQSDYASFYFWMNQVQVAKAWALKMALRVVEYAVYGDLTTPLQEPAASLSQALHDSLWAGPRAVLLVGGLALAGLWALWLHLRGRLSRAWGTLGGSVLILLLVALVLSGGEQALQSAVTLSRGLAAGIFQTADQATAGTSLMDLPARSGDGAWRILVYEPWLTGELSAAGVAAYRAPDGLAGGQFLGMSMTQRHGLCLYNATTAQANCPWWSVEYLPRRMMIALWTGTVGLLLAGGMVVLGGSVILAQLTLLLFLALAPVWLMAALWWPEGGMRLVQGVVMRTVQALIGQTVLAAALAAFLAFITAVPAAFPNGGWVFQSVLLLALAVLAVRYRFGWLAPFTLISERAQVWLGDRGRRPAADRLAPQAAQPVLPESARETAPVFASLSIPSSAWQQPEPKREAPEQSRPFIAEIERPVRSPSEFFRTELARVHDELLLRQETVLYDRTLERSRGGTTPELSPSVLPEGQSRPPTSPQRKLPDSPPRPRPTA